MEKPSPGAGSDTREARSRGVGIPVHLHYGDGACSTGTATVIGTRGMFVETGMAPSREGCVDVRLTAHCTTGKLSVRMPSVIVSRSRIGVELLFRRLDDQAQQALQELLTARQS